MPDLIRILIADDHTVVRSGLHILLAAEPDFDVIGEALDGKEALEMADTLAPDVILMDITMPVMDGLEATRQIKQRNPDIQVLILTMHRSDEYFFEILKAGASGYVLKGAKISELVDAIRAVMRSEVYLSPAMAQKLAQGYLQIVEWESEHGPSLSYREREILSMIAEGYTNKEIAEKLVISTSTVHSHRSNLMNKLGLSSSRDLIQFARRRGLIRD